MIALVALALAQDAPAEPALAPDETTAAPDPLAALKATVAELAAAREATERANAALTDALARQQAELDALNAAVTRNRLKLLETSPLSFDLEGSFRIRGHLFNHLYASQGEGDAYRDARFMDMQLRLEPIVRYKDLASLHVEVRGLDGVLFGDNAGLNSTALFAQDPSNTGRDGQEVPSLRMSRAWVEVGVPVGQLRFGRMPTHWGLGLLANDGNGFDDWFGENRFTNTNDRVLFATRPVSIVQAILGRDGPEIPIITAIAVDRIVEDPLVQYHGYRCTAGVTASDGRYDARCDTDGDGVTDRDHDWSTERAASSRRRDWWVDQNDDVLQMVYVLAYRGDDVKVAGKTGDVHVGAYMVNRTQRETESNAWIADGHFKVDVAGLYAEAEGVLITGRTRALTLPDFSADDPLAKQARIAGYVGRFGVRKSDWELLLETGFASGDEQVNDAEFSGRALNPDHNVGLLLYEEVLAEVTAAFWTQSANGLWSQGGVYNSRYVFPTAAVRPLENWELRTAFLLAWPHRADGAILRCRSRDRAGCASPDSLQATTDLLGWELDLALKHRWHEHVLFSVEGAIAKATDRISLASAGLNPNGNFVTLQSRLAWEF